ncbi:MAG: hypothetical protein RLZZ338_1745 [Cyanobacteriota bacterium]
MPVLEVACAEHESVSLRDHARERDAPTANLQTTDGPVRRTNLSLRAHAREGDAPTANL